MKKLIIFILIMFASILSAQITGNKSTNILGNNLRTNIIRATNVLGNKLRTNIILSTQNVRIVSTNQAKAYTRSYVSSVTSLIHVLYTNESKAYTRSFVSSVTSLIHVLYTNESKAYTRSFVTSVTGLTHTLYTNESKAYTRSYGALITNGMYSRGTIISNGSFISGTNWVISKGYGAGGSKPDLVYSFPSGSQLGTVGMEEAQITNGKIIVMTFDDTTEENVGGDVIQVPSDIKTNGYITINAYGYAKTAVSTASNKIQLKFYHSRAGTNEGHLLATYYSNRTSGDLVTSATQGNLKMYTITNHIGMAGLKWMPLDQVRVKLSRIASSTGKLIGDWFMTLWTIRIPRE